tara:strand:+ start:751 stop:945 length:195 start_codon:yes stop_codon:yes gene_type:complete
MVILCRNNFIGVNMDFIKARLKERTSLDGAMLIGGGIMMILAPVNLIAYGMIAYGAWTLYKKED